MTATLTKLEREIKEIQERLREQEAQRGASLEEIALDMQRKQDDYKASKLAIYQLEQFVKVRLSFIQECEELSPFCNEEATRTEIVDEGDERWTRILLWLHKTLHPPLLCSFDVTMPNPWDTTSCHHLCCVQLTDRLPLFLSFSFSFTSI